MWLFLLACQTLPPPPGPPSSIETEDSEATAQDSEAPTSDSAGTDSEAAAQDSEASPTDSEADPVELVQRCPSDMVPITEGDSIAFCVDPYEVVVDGVNTSSRDPSYNNATTQSLAGEIPSVGISFDNARKSCENTPVLDELGEERGRKWLITSQQWEDAADGTVGAGGLTFPYGEEYVEGVCAVLDEGGSGFNTLQPAGSLEDCVSPFGVYDSIGNAWEWSDPELVLSIDDFMKVAGSHDIEFTLTKDDYIGLSQEGDLSKLQVEVTGLDQNGLTVVDGMLEVPVNLDTWTWDQSNPKGYLKLQQGIADPEDPSSYLPIVAEPKEDDEERAWLRLLWDEDGQPLTDKRGCAYYSGVAASCTNTTRYMGHVHDFDGTIGFRCAAAPYEDPA